MQLRQSTRITLLQDIHESLLLYHNKIILILFVQLFFTSDENRSLSETVIVEDIEYFYVTFSGIDRVDYIPGLAVARVFIIDNDGMHTIVYPMHAE